MLFGIETKALLWWGKWALVAAVAGLLVNKGMMLERARWVRALDKANAEIAVVNTDAEAKIAAAEAERDKAISTARAALAAAKLGEELLPDDLVKKANDIR